MKNKKSKVGLWSALTAITAVLTIAAIVGNIIANQYATTINVALNASTYQIIHDSSNTEDTEYFKKGFASDEEREAYEAELCAQVEAEGAALLKNQNAALPLAQGAKVSLFGHGSVDLMYGGTVPALSIPARLPTSSRLWSPRASPSTRPCGTCTALTP